MWSNFVDFAINFNNCVEGNLNRLLWLFLSQFSWHITRTCWFGIDYCRIRWWKGHVASNQLEEKLQFNFLWVISVIQPQLWVNYGSTLLVCQSINIFRVIPSQSHKTLWYDTFDVRYFSIILYHCHYISYKICVPIVSLFIILK